jgi:hypothetical protein
MTEKKIVAGNPEDLTPEDAQVVTGEFQAFLTNIGMIICFEKVIENGEEYWSLPLVLETVSQRDPKTNEVVRSQGFRPFVPLTKETKFKPTLTNSMLAVQILDTKLENAYRNTVQEIRYSLAGIVTPQKQPVVSENSGIIIGS